VDDRKPQPLDSVRVLEAQFTKTAVLQDVGGGGGAVFQGSLLGWGGGVELGDACRVL